MPQTQKLTEVHDYWNAGSCGTNVAVSTKHSLAYFEEIENFRYTVEPFIHAFAQFTRWRGKKMLEVGVGAGSDFLQWVRAGTQANGVDLTQEGVENVKARLDAYGLQADSLQVANAENLPFADNTFDLVYSWGVIHHSPDTLAALDQIIRVLKPGGTAKIMVYNINAPHTWFRFLCHALPRGKFKNGRRWAVAHFQESPGTKVYSPSELRKILEARGIKDVTFSFYDQLIRKDAKFSGLRRLVQHLTPTSWRWYLAFEFKKPV